MARHDEEEGDTGLGTRILLEIWLGRRVVIGPAVDGPENLRAAE